MSSLFVAGGAISSNCCGGMAMDYVCLQSVWSVDASSGRRRKVEPLRSLQPSYRCCWKASIGAGQYAHTHRNCRYSQATEHAGEVSNIVTCVVPLVVHSLGCDARAHCITRSQ